jgi:hypothetical protein
VARAAVPAALVLQQLERRNQDIGLRIT